MQCAEIINLVQISQMNNPLSAHRHCAQMSTYHFIRVSNFVRFTHILFLNNRKCLHHTQPSSTIIKCVHCTEMEASARIGWQISQINMEVLALNEHQKHNDKN